MAGGVASLENVVDMEEIVVDMEESEEVTVDMAAGAAIRDKK